MTDKFDEDVVSIDSERARKLHKNVKKLLNKINKPKKFSINNCFKECIESGDFEPLHIYINSQINEIGIQYFLEKVDVSPSKVITALKSNKPMNIILLSKILKGLDLNLSIKK